MPRVIAIHGIGHQYSGESSMASIWYPALSDGLRRASSALPEKDFGCAFYGHIFRKPEQLLSSQPLSPPLHALDLDHPFDADFLLSLWIEASRIDDSVLPPNSDTLVAAPNLVQRALRALTQSSFFCDISERLFINSLVQVRLYMTDPQIRQSVRLQLERAISEQTGVIIAHSLGAVVAYETLAAHPEWNPMTFVTLGAPLGIRNLIFDRLEPPPLPDDSSGQLLGRWPGSVGHWINISDRSDIIALVKDLRPGFGPHIDNYVVDNGVKPHDAIRYLTTEVLGRAVQKGLAQPLARSRTALE